MLPCRYAGATYSALRNLAQHLELSSSKADDGGEGEGEKLHGDGYMAVLGFRERVKASKQMNGNVKDVDVDEGQEGTDQTPGMERYLK